MIGVKRARKKDKYQTITVNTHRKAQRLIGQGWELVSNSGSESFLLGNSARYILRRPNPRYRGDGK